MSGTSLLLLGTIGAALIIAVIRYLIDLGEEKATYCAPVAALLLSSILPLLLVPVKFCCVTFAYFLFVYPAIEATESNIAPVVKKIEKSAEYELTIQPACAILCVTGLTTRVKAEAAAVTGCDSSEKITNCLLGRLGRTCPGVSLTTLSTQSPLFRALTSAGKVTENPQSKGVKNDLRPVSGAVPARPSRVPVVKSDCRSFAADHPRRGEYRPRREETASKLPFRRSGSNESRLARAGRHARSVTSGGAYL